MDSFITAQNIQDLAIRQKEQCKIAHQLAEFLVKLPKVFSSLSVFEKINGLLIDQQTTR